jgi:hypothetical protein
MGTFLGTIFTNENTEYSTGLLADHSIDYTDWPVPAGISIAPGSQLGGSGYLVTAQIPALGYYEIQFMLASTVFGCNFQHGNSACGVNIRQGIAHMIDKTVFASSDSGIPTGTGIPIDNPVPSNAAIGLLTPYSCTYDNLSGTVAGWHDQPNAALCSVGAGVGGNNIGGGSYHFHTAGVDGTCTSVPFTWLQCPGSPDLNEAAAHFVLAGVATGCDGAIGAASCLTSTDSKLSGQTAPICGTPNCSFFVRNDNPPRLDLGNGLSESMCYILTGTYGTPGCGPLQVTQGPITAFPGFTTSTTSEATTWGMYTAAYQGPTFYDGSLFFTYNSAFVSGIGSNQAAQGGPCSNAAVPSESASNYMYLCNTNYDNLSTQLEVSPCLVADQGGDPVVGAFSNAPTGAGLGRCTNGVLSSHSASIQAQAAFGQGVYTLPVFQTKDQYGYLQCTTPTACTGGPTGNSWTRTNNNACVGIANYFNWLNAWNPNPGIAGTIRQGFKETTRSVSPYIASTVWDTYITGNVYDSLYAQNPLNCAQFFNWMTENTAGPLTSVSYNGGTGGVTETPPGTAATYRFTLRPDLTFQDGRPVTSYDVAFSYLSEVGNGAFLATAASVMSGITILSPTVFDISVSSQGPFTLPNLTTIPIIPGRYWNGVGQSAWDTAIANCEQTACGIVQYTLAGTIVQCIGACQNAPGSDVVITGTAPAVGTALGTDPKIKFIDHNNANPTALAPAAAPNTAEARETYDTTIIQDNNIGIAGCDGVYQPVAVGACTSADVLIFNAPGNAAPVAGNNLSVDTKLKFVGGASWVAGNPVIQDSDSSGTYTVNGIMQVNHGDLGAGFDAIKNHILIGSGPWQCSTGANLGFACSTPLGTGNHSTSYTLTAFPNYFRSSQRLAIYLWSGENDQNPVVPATNVGACFNVAVNLAGPCGHFQQGAGNPGAGTTVSVTVAGNVDIFFNLNWLSPFEWATTPPTGIAPLPPLLYGPGTTFTPNPGGSSCTTPNNFYDC